MIDPFASLEQVLTQAVDAMRRRIESVWQIMWMLRVTGPPGNEQDTSKFVVVRGAGTPVTDSAPDLTEATTPWPDCWNRTATNFGSSRPRPPGCSG